MTDQPASPAPDEARSARLRYAYDEGEGFFVDMSKVDEHGEGEELLVQEVVDLLNSQNATLVEVNQRLATLEPKLGNIDANTNALIDQLVIAQRRLESLKEFDVETVRVCAETITGRLAGEKHNAIRLARYNFLQRLATALAALARQEFKDGLSAERETTKRRVEALELVRTVFSWIVEDKPVMVHGYVMGHHALDPIHDLPMFFREFPAVDREGWMAKHAEDMDRLVALAPSTEEA